MLKNNMLIAFGAALMMIGLALAALFGSMDVPAEGVAGIAVAAILGSGICVLLLAGLRRILSVSRSRLSNEIEIWVNRTKLTLCFSMAASVVAFALLYGGVAVAFINFNFASGTNDIGLIMMLTGFAVGAIAIMGDLVGIVFGGIVWKTLGNRRWLLAAIAVLVVHAMAIYVAWSWNQ
jgi:hypothetical protein